jgi:hypothetical protein
MTDMQTVTPKRGVRIIHVETPLGIVNINIGLTDIHGRRVENVQMRPNVYAGEPRVTVVGNRFVELKGKRQ